MVDPRNPPNANAFTQYHTIVVQRQMSLPNLESIKLLKARGCKIVYDLDDHLWNIPPWNPMRKVFTGMGLSNGMVPCLRLCDHVIVSTPLLKEVVDSKIDGAVPVTVIENAIDLNLFVHSRQPVKRDYIVVGWAGSNTHDADIMEAMQALAHLMVRRKDIHARFMALEVPKALANDSRIAARIKLAPFVAVWQYPAWWSNIDWDVALAPLIQHEFNRAKSSVKLLESGALEMPCIASNLDSYKAFVQGDEILEQLITTGTRSDWIRKIERMIDEPEFRLEAGRRARKRVEERYNIEKQVTKWAEVFTKL